MDVEICIHGKPLAHETFSTAAEQANDINYFCNSFFENHSDYQDQSLVAETKIWQNRIYSYYTYNRNNIKDLFGRTAYFAITLRTDSFVKNLHIIYNVLEIVYNQFVIGTILSKEKDTKYAIEKFEKVGKKICDIILNLLSQVIQTKDIVRLDDTFLANSGVPLSFNPCDNRCLDLLSEYKKAEKLIISPSSSLLREQQKAKEYQQKLEYIKKETEERYASHIKKMQADVQMLQKERENALSELNNHKKELKDHVCVLEQELQESKQKIKSLSDQANLKSELVKISEPLIRLNTLLQRFGIAAPSLQKNQTAMRRFDADFEKKRPEKVSSFKNSNIWKIALLIFALASILLILVLFFQIKLYSQYNNSYVQEPKVELKTDVEPTNVIESKTEQVSSVIENLDGARIDIKGYSGKGGLQYGKEYILFVSDRYSKPIEDVDGIKWNCDGGEIDVYGRVSARLRINRNNGFVRIMCVLPNGRSIERELKIQSVTEDNSSMQTSKPSPVRISKKDESVSKQLPSKNSKFKE